jgi:prepilin-type N-terminal cleavage/methylation domain-containing protein
MPVFKKSKNKKNFKKGFTLLELAIVLAVMTFLLSNLTLGLQAGLNVYRAKKNRERMDLIKQSINTYFSKNMRLPCPSNPFLDSKDANFGQENLYIKNIGQDVHSECWLQFSRQGIQDASGSQTPPLAIKTSGDQNPEYTVFGGVPVRELGLSSDMAFDIYGNTITYVVPSFITSYGRTNYMKESNSKFQAQNSIQYNKISHTGYTKYGEYIEKQSNSNNGVRWINNYALFTLPDQNSNDNITEYRIFYPFHMVMRDIEERIIFETEYNVGFVIISHGENGYGSWQKNGLIKDFPSNTTSLEKNNSYTGIIEKICPTKTNCDIKTIQNERYGLDFYTGTKKDQSDDVVIYDTVSNLIKQNGFEKLIYCNLTSINEATRLTHSEIVNSTSNEYIMGMSRPLNTTEAGIFIKHNDTFTYLNQTYLCMSMGNPNITGNGQQTNINNSNNTNNP